MAKTMWTREEAIIFIRELSLKMQLAGYEIALAGGVLKKGKSSKDLDLIIFPTTTERANLVAARNSLRSAGLVCLMPKEEVQARWLVDHGSRDKKHVEVWRYKGKRVDLFFLT
jgi:hypothetical protein